MYLLGENDKTLQGTIPKRLMLIAKREPREEAIGISQQQTVDGKVAANSYQTVFFTQMRIREPEFIV